ncbi:unnamed protein product [Camellia sinensis]
MIEWTYIMHRGQGKPPKKPNNYNNKLLLSVASQPIAKKPRGKPSNKLSHFKNQPYLGFHSQSIARQFRTKTLTFITKERVTLNVPNSSDVSAATVSGILKRIPSDDERTEKFPSWNNKKKRKDRKRCEKLNSPLVLENCSSRSCLWEIPGPIPPDIFHIELDDSFFSNFFRDIPNFDD